MKPTLAVATLTVVCLAAVISQAQGPTSPGEIAALALRYAQDATSILPTSPTASNLKGKIRSAERRFTRADTAYRGLLNVDPAGLPPDILKTYEQAASSAITSGFLPLWLAARTVKAAAIAEGTSSLIADTMTWSGQPPYDDTSGTGTSYITCEVIHVSCTSECCHFNTFCFNWNTGGHWVSGYNNCNSDHVYTKE